MHFASENISRSTAYRLLSSTITPRPIAFVTSVDGQGRVNGAPFSFFNGMGSAPPVVVLGFEPNTDGSQKDTPNNIMETGEFVVNLVDEPLAGQMNMAAANLKPGEDELAHAGLAAIASLGVAPPRIAAAPVSLECTLFQDTPLPGGGRIIIGQVLHFHVRDDLLLSTDPVRIDVEKYAPIGRLSGPYYARINDRFALERPGALPVHKA